MKKTILNLGAILLAFVIGVSINNACADSIDNMNDSELRKLVAELQQEVNDLKDRVAELERKNRNGSGNGSSNNDTGGEFEVNGLHFNRSGQCSNMVDYCETTTYYYNGEIGKSISTCTYDSNGRLSMVQGNGKQTYSYDNKTMTINYMNLNTDGEYETYLIYEYHYK